MTFARLQAKSGSHLRMRRRLSFAGSRKSEIGGSCIETRTDATHAHSVSDGIYLVLKGGGDKSKRYGFVT